MFKYYSPGKLLLTAEYLVLNGAQAFALPTQKGQHMQVSPIEQNELKWKSITSDDKKWIDVTLELTNFECIENHGTPLAIIEKLSGILKYIRTIQPNFCLTGHEVHNVLEFDRSWGLGSSSTFINNLAQWANVNPYEILNNTFGGSGYDLAVAQKQSPILYTRNDIKPLVKSIPFNPDFKDQLYFVHLNQKQDSQNEVAAYNKRPVPSSKQIDHANRLTSQMIQAKTLNEFNNVLIEHEKLIGAILKQLPIQERLFSDFEGQTKSLGAWGGDFILATGDSCLSYFREKGYKIVVPYSEMISK